MGESTDHYSDVWAIGVITYFLLCGYTPFDRGSNLDEMQAILVADYSFTPVEYWRGVSESAKDFIRRCLTIDSKKRMTAHEALAHPWISPTAGSGDAKGSEDLLPIVKKNFNARRTLHQAIDTIRAINKLREGGAQRVLNGAVNKASQNLPLHNNGNGMEVEGEPGSQFLHQGGDEMDIDSGPQGQTSEEIQAQERRIPQTTTGLWQRPIA